MSDYLSNLVIRTQHPERTLLPHVSSRFVPVSPASMGGEVSGWDPGEELYQPVSRPDLSAHQSLETTGQDRAGGGLFLEREARPREMAPISTPDGVGLAASSETASTAIPNVQSSAASDQREAPSRNPSDDSAINLSPIDPSVVAGSSFSERLRTAEGNQTSWPRSPAQSTGSSLRIPSEQMNSAGQGENSVLRDASSGESQDISSAAPTTQAYNQELNSRTNSREVRVNASSSRQPLVGTGAARSDGEQLHRLPTVVSESEEALPEVGKQAVGHNVRDFSLDPSLVAPVRTTKGVAPSHYRMSSQPGDSSGKSSSALDQQELIDAPRSLPRTSNNFLAVRRAASSMTASSMSQLTAADRGRPAEPVVQVTIGRVEVRAVAPPVRHQKNPKPQAAMSLDDYLKHRGGRSGG